MRPLAAPLRHLLGTLLGALLMLGALLAAMAPPALAMENTGALAQRLEDWPQWQLPAPLPRPGRTDLIYPDWFEGQWQASLQDASGLQP